MPGEVMLISGEPGIGKSTLLLQVCLKLSGVGKVMYVSGEESLGQISTRFERISKATGKKVSADKSSNFIVTDETNVDRIISSIHENKPVAVFVDSIQAVSTSDVDSFAGSVSQVRECGSRLTDCAKKTHTPIFIVGQVTKEGVVAGPKVLEHIVDAVIYFEGDDLGIYRILRGMKNRFGPTDEVGIFRMTGSGLSEVDDPSNVFCSIDAKSEPGVVKSAVYKGSRVLFVEIQALTTQAAFGAPRRLSTGFSKARLEMLCAVLGRRANIDLSNDDVFVNVVGGIKIDDPAIDLAVCIAIASIKKNRAVDSQSVFVGEVGLSGNVRYGPLIDKIRSEGKRRRLSIISASEGKSLSLQSVIKTTIK